jgi:HK97 family phage portal protein
LALLKGLPSPSGIFASVARFLNNVRTKLIGNSSFSIVTSLGIITHKFTDFKSYQDALKRISAVYRSCDIITNYFQKTKWSIVDATGKPLKGGDGVRKVTALLKNPNEYTRFADFKSTISFDLLLTGNAFILKDQMNAKGQPLTLNRLYPQYMTIKTNVMARIEYYQYRLPGLEPQRYEVDEVIHIKFNPDSQNEYWGLGPMGANEDLYSYSIDLSSHRKNFIRNGAVPSGILTTDQAPSDDVLKQLRKYWDKGFSGSKNAGKTPILIAGTKYQQVGLSSDQLQYLEDKKFNLTEIFMMFGVPPIFTGFDPEKIKYDNALEQRKIFMEGTIQPLLDLFDEAITEELVVNYLPEAQFKHKDVTGIKSPDVIHQSVQRGIISPNEAREELGFARKELKPELDMHYIPMNWITVDAVSGLNNPALTAPGGKPPAEGEGDGKSIKVMPPITSMEKFIPNGKPRKKTWRDKAGTGWASIPPQGVWRLKDFSDNETVARIQRDFLRIGRQSQNYKMPATINMVTEFLNGQIARVIDNFNALKSFKPIHTKVSEDVHKEAMRIVAEIWNRDIEDPLIKQIFNSAWQSGADKGLDDVSSILTFEIDPDDARAEIAKRVNTMRETGPRVNEFTRELLGRTIANGIEAGENQAEIAKRIQAEMDDYNTSRPLRIARNEIAEAYRQGARVGMKQGQVITHVSVVGCEDREPNSPTYRGESTCNIDDVPMEDVDQLNYHVNHTGMEVPSKFATEV